ncbi:ribonuclease 3 [Clostridia bacterium]|nr:ribonuclease 3 [Clostridia bacterium]
MNLAQQLEMFQERIGYRFRDTGLLIHALTHSSYTNEKHKDKRYCNERLEFLGDAVLELASSDALYRKYPTYHEGQLTRLRAALVCESALVSYSKPLDIGQFLLMGKGEEKNGGRMRDSILSDALEAVIGAIYLDGGFANAKEFVDRMLLSDIKKQELFFDSKTILQELIQGGEIKKGELSYHLVGEAGPDHDKRFISEVHLSGKPIGSGEGRSKKAAEQEAAYQALLLRNDYTINCNMRKI